MPPAFQPPPPPPLKTHHQVSIQVVHRLCTRYRPWWKYNASATNSDNSAPTMLVVQMRMDELWPFAFLDDGSCAFPDQVVPESETYVFGCTDELAENYNADAVASDGSCLRRGLQNESTNFDPEAVWMTGCIFDSDSSAPTDVVYTLDRLDPASNYNPDGLWWWKSCVYIGDAQIL